VTHLFTTAIFFVWSFVVTNIDDFVLLTALFVTAGQSGPTVRQIVSGHYLGIALLGAVSLAAAVGLAEVPAWWIGLFGLVPIVLGVRAILIARRSEPEGERVPPIASAVGVAALTVADGADNVSISIPLFRQSGADTTATSVVVFGVLVGVWCLAAHALAHRRALVVLVERIERWLVPCSTSPSASGSSWSAACCADS
jgi:cadmium resistance protein CadD (predicted permease)